MEFVDSGMLLTDNQRMTGIRGQGCIRPSPPMWVLIRDTPMPPPSSPPLSRSRHLTRTRHHSSSSLHFCPLLSLHTLSHFHLLTRPSILTFDFDFQHPLSFLTPIQATSFPHGSSPASSPFPCPNPRRPHSRILGRNQRPNETSSWPATNTRFQSPPTLLPPDSLTNLTRLHSSGQQHVQRHAYPVNS